MARKWWGTVNLPADVDGRCNDPCHHQAITSGNTVGCAVVTWRIGRRGGVGCMGNCWMHGDETLVYVPPWAVLLHRPETLGAFRKNRPLSSALPAAGALGSWPALGRKPAISMRLGTKMEAIGMMLKVAESWDGFMPGAGHF